MASERTRGWMHVGQETGLIFVELILTVFKFHSLRQVLLLFCSCRCGKALETVDHRGTSKVMMLMKYLCVDLWKNVKTAESHAQLRLL